MEIFPAIDIIGGQVVRLKEGDYSQVSVYGDNPLAMASRFAEQGAKNLHVVDLDGAKEGAAAETQVLPLGVERFVDEEVFLFRADAGGYAAGLGVAKETENPKTLTVDRVHRTEKGSLLVQGLAGVGAEDGGDAEGVLLDEGEGGGVPGGVAPGLEGGPEAAGGEGGGVRLAPDQLLAGELHHNPAAAGGADEAVVLFGGDAGHGLEPVGEVGGAPLHGPLLHGLGDFVGGGDIQGRALGDAFFPRAVRRGGQAVLHGLLVEDPAAEEFRELERGTHNRFLLNF